MRKMVLLLVLVLLVLLVLLVRYMIQSLVLCVVRCRLRVPRAGLDAVVTPVRCHPVAEL